MGLSRVQFQTTRHDSLNCGPAGRPVIHVPPTLRAFVLFVSFCSLEWLGLRKNSTAFLLLTLLLAAPVFAQVNVRTLGGGRLAPTGRDAGYVDGNTLQHSQFNAPFGAAVDLLGNVFIADRDNGAVRKLDVAANRSSTVLAGLNQPVAVAVDRTNNLYILTQGDGLLVKLDRFGTLSTNEHRFLSPAALALDEKTNIYVAESGGDVFRIDGAAGTKIPFVRSLTRASGIALLESGVVAVSQPDNHQIVFFGPKGDRVDRAGSGTAGFRDGPMANAQFNQPHHLARAPDGSLVVADHGNHRLRVIRTDGVVTTLYGVDPKLWEGPECLTCNPIILPGWLDSSSEFAEAREPVGVAVSREGKAYVTENYYHLVREVTGGGLTGGPGAGGAGTNLVVLPPVVIPDSGYYPLGQDITVINPNTNAFFSNAIFYTTDGTAPTTNSLRLALSNNVSTIRWRETTRDLTSLRLLAFVGSAASPIVSGKPATTNEIGVTRDIAAAPGSTVVVPVTVNLRPIDGLKSLQFRVEVAPKTTGAPMIPERFRALSISTNDFIRVVTSSESSGASTFRTSSYTTNLSGSTDLTRGLMVTFIGTNANFSVKNFAVVAMLAVPIPPEAKLDDRYSISVVSPSGTSDGAEAAVPLSTMRSTDIVVAETAYWVGDSSPATWYNGDASTVVPASATQIPRHRVIGSNSFGNRQLDNSDVNNAFAAALGERVPYPFTDLFDALDVFPEDWDGRAGGDGLIRFLDWQIILRRSLGLDPALWVRYWSTHGVRVSETFPRALLPNSPATILKGPPGQAAWHRHASVTATAQENVLPGVPTDIPVYVTVGAGYRVSGLAFRATLHSDGDAPALRQPLQFIPAKGMPMPIQSAGLSPNVLLCGWPLVPTHSFDPPLQNKTLIGSIRFTLPNTAQAGQTYTLHFANADGSPDLQTQYDFESRPASVWVQTTARRQPEIISDEWRLHFFGSLDSPAIQADTDPDQDGADNLAEYLAGTNPIDTRSSLRLEAADFQAESGSVRLRWFGAPGRIYTLESSLGLQPPDWKAIAADLPGQGVMQEFTHRNAGTAPRFYRLLLKYSSNL